MWLVAKNITRKPTSLLNDSFFILSTHREDETSMSCSTSNLGCLIYNGCKSFPIIDTAYPCRREFFKHSVKIAYFL